MVNEGVGNQYCRAKAKGEGTQYVHVEILLAELSNPFYWAKAGSDNTIFGLRGGVDLTEAQKCVPHENPVNIRKIGHSATKLSKGHGAYPCQGNENDRFSRT